MLPASGIRERNGLYHFFAFPSLPDLQFMKSFSVMKFTPDLHEHGKAFREKDPGSSLLHGRRDTALNDLFLWL